MGADDEPLLHFRCSRCEMAEESFSSLKRPDGDCYSITIKNIPPGFTQVGVTNLCLTVGTPLSCTYSPGRTQAIVQFKTMNEAELAYRDLHNKPPYNLKIVRNYQHFGSDANKSVADVGLKDSEPWDFSIEETPVESKMEDDSEKMNELINQVRGILGSLSHDPSLRMRQKILDFKTRSECVSRGRGYVSMGKEDRFVGGLQKFVFSSKNGKAKDTMVFHCKNCESATTKICGNCHASYCSISCLRESSTNHLECSTPPGDKEGEDVNNISSSGNSKHGPGYVGVTETFPEVTFESNCRVLMTSYYSMCTVFLRRTDGVWEDRFARLCNDVALHGLRGESFKETPEEGEVVAAKYYGDLCFHRGRVLSKSENKVSVLFLDFGNTQVTLLEDLKPLPDHLRSIPAQAVHVRLKDVPEDSSLDSVEYLNGLTARQVPLILMLDSSTEEVVLLEKDSNTEVNKTVVEKALPSWKKDGFTFTNLGENYFLSSVGGTELEVSKTYTLIVSHFDEKEFREFGLFWATLPDTYEYNHVRTRMRLAMMDYCRLLGEDYYLPRIKELCLAKDNGEWHRCINLRDQKTTCYLFFLDKGYFSYIERKNIRKMIQDFTEAPLQAICCVLPKDPRMTDNRIRSKAIDYLKNSMGQRVDSVTVLEIDGDAYALSFPRINEILNSKPEP